MKKKEKKSIHICLTCGRWMANNPETIKKHEEKNCIKPIKDEEKD